MRLITPEKLLEILSQTTEDDIGSCLRVVEISPSDTDPSRQIYIEGTLNLEELARRINQYCSQPGIHSKTKVRSGTA